MMITTSTHDNYIQRGQLAFSKSISSTDGSGKAHKYKSQFQTKLIWPTTTSQNLKEKKNHNLLENAHHVYWGTLYKAWVHNGTSGYSGFPYFFPPALIFIYMTTYIDFYPIRGKPLQQWKPPIFYPLPWKMSSTKHQKTTNLFRSALVWSILTLHQTTPLIKKTDWLLGDKKSSKAPTDPFFSFVLTWEKEVCKVNQSSIFHSDEGLGRTEEIKC